MKKIRLLFAAFLAVALTLAACASEDLTPEQLWDEAQGRGAILIDVRRPDEFNRGHVPGSINLPLNDLELDIPHVVPNLDQEILLICQSGNRTRAAYANLIAMGFTNVTDIGGVITWTGDLVTN